MAKNFNESVDEIVKKDKEERLETLINNLLYEITSKMWEADKDTYLNWLTSEVGFTWNELTDLTSKGKLPMPIELNRE